MTQRLKIRLALVGILILAIGAGVIDYPKGPNIHIGDYEKEVKVHLGLDLQGGTSLLYDADVTEIPADERAGALDGVRDVIERRINAFGVSEPNIQTIRSGAEDWRVLVELPGITDITEAINRIGETPLLEFKTEGEPPEIPEEQKLEIRAQNEVTKGEAQAVLDRVLAGEDFEALAKEFSKDPGSAEKGGDLGEIQEGVMVPEFNTAVFETGVVGEVIPELVQTDFGYHIVRVDERTDVDAAVEPPVAEEGEEATPAAGSTARARHILFNTIPEEPQFQGPFYEDTQLTGEQLERADVTFDQNSGLPTVSLTFNNEGKELFGQITRDNIKKTVAIYLDGSIISAPVVQQEITTGEAVISGDFTLDESKELAQRLYAGALPVPVELISQQNIGPTLGKTSIERSLFAAGFGMILLAIFMIVYYRLPGLMAIVSLGVYFLVILAIFKLWPVTLTLAGIAGLILSIGMAVDANVLIFERFKEEMRRGKSTRQSMDDGFTRAWSSIRDSNISSLITCIILYWFGTSLIRGFAITLAIGIVISMFSAIIITRNLLRVFRVKNTWWYGIKRND